MVTHSTPAAFNAGALLIVTLRTTSLSFPAPIMTNGCGVLNDKSLLKALAHGLASVLLFPAAKYPSVSTLTTLPSPSLL